VAGITRLSLRSDDDARPAGSFWQASALAASAYGYSNTNYIVLGLLIQAVTHRSLGWELGRRVFGPLGLRHTSFPPGDPAAQSGLGIERYQDRCGVTWGHGGQIPGYQDAAYWNQRTHRVVVLATTLWPGATPAAEALISNAYDYALCPPGS
jgi:CubicO group peptidase (beta-lactamase class C family)